MQKKLQERLSALAPQSSTKPRNLVTRCGARLRGTHHSNRFPVPMTWETPEERTAIEALDASFGILDLLSQPAQLEIPSEDGSFSYTPDVAVLWKDGSIWVVECKPQDVLEQLDIRSKHNAISMHLMSYDIRFVELPNEVQPSAAVRGNLSVLHRPTGPVQYPRAKREEDRRQIAANCPNTFRRARCSRRRSIRGRSACPRAIAFRLPRTVGSNHTSIHSI